MTDIAAEQSDLRPAAEAADARVVSVSRDTTHKFSKVICKSITLLAGLGVEGDAHMGVTVKHRSRVRRDPSQPNLRQVHLMHDELIDALQQQGFAISAKRRRRRCSTPDCNDPSRSIAVDDIGKDHCPAARRGAVASRGKPGLRLEYRALLLRANGDRDGAVSGEPPADPLRRRAIAAAWRSILAQHLSEAIGDNAFHRLEEEFDWAELSAQA